MVLIMHALPVDAIQNQVLQEVVFKQWSLAWLLCGLAEYRPEPVCIVRGDQLHKAWS